MAVTSKRVYNWYISLMAAMCMVLYGYDASVYNSLQGSKNWLAWVDVDLKKDTQLIGLVNTAYTIGAIVAGFFIGGPLADQLGRRWGMAIGCFVTIIATLMQTFTPHHKLGVFIAGRVIIGLGQGMALTAGPVYIGEVAPSQIRGHIMACWQMFYSVGSFIAYWINYACSKHRASLGEWDWKMVVIFQMLVPIIIIIALPFQPERWCVQKKGDIDSARAALMRIRDTEQEVEEELLTIREAVEYEKEAISSSYSALFKDASIRKRLYLAFVLNVGQQLTGQGTLNSYSTAIYKKVWPSDDTINLINALNATCGILFTLNAMWTADRSSSSAPPAWPSACSSESVGIAIVFLLFLFTFFYKPSWGATTWMYTSEIFSVNVRAQAVGMCSQMQNVANTIFQQFFPTFLANEGLKCLFFFMGMNMVLGVFVYFFIPETKQIPLEEVDVLFGGANHIEKGGQIMGVDNQHPGTASGSEKDGAQVQQTERKEVV
uniref:Sugar transporter n=1 Tax=Colletotrichum fructicola (strain Nara gc5) TaxID=1213859 RepID=L2FMR9_COLFN